MIDLPTFHSCLAQPIARGYDLDDQQKQAVEYGDRPLWLLAGPGSGKSEVLVTRALKLLCVDGVKPRSILLTTFTTKAARNLEDRLASYLAALQTTNPILQGVDLANIRIGTLHSLCNDILQEYRYPGYQNVRLLDGVERDLFAYRYSDISDYHNLDFWQHFEYTVRDWRNPNYPPNKWKRTKAAVTLFNHIVEDCVDLQQMVNAGSHWATLAELYKQYTQALQENYRCDFAHLQACFLEFLNSAYGQQFLQGDSQNLPLMYVLVDEYQDTNSIQERIYLALARHTHHNNITVVGDDDQALYRFRGGNVACMVNFDKACLEELGQPPHRIQLAQNYRSHPDIVEFLNQYITSFPEMTAPEVRAPGKDFINSASSITGDYPAVSWIQTRRVRDLANDVGKFINNHLMRDGIISDLSQCVLLMRSTRDSPRNAGPFIAAFQQLGIPIYNPRSKSFMESEEVQCLLATLVQVIDFKYRFQLKRDPQGRPFWWIENIQEWLNTLEQVRNNPDLPTKARPFQGIEIPVPNTPNIKRRYSVTQDIVSFRRCARQYGAFNVYKYAPAYQTQTYFGTILHQVLDRCHTHFHGKIDSSTKGSLPDNGQIISDEQILDYFDELRQAEKAKAIKPIAPSEIVKYFVEVENGLKSQGIRAITQNIRLKAVRLLQYFNALEGSTLYPRVKDTEHRLQAKQTTHILHGVVDLLVDTPEETKNPADCEMWDYKGNSFLDVNPNNLENYEFQMRVYAKLYELKHGVLPKKAVLYFLNELDGSTCPSKRPVNALLEVSLAPNDISAAVNEFAQTVEQIEQARLTDRWNPALFGSISEKDCNICDLRWDCPTPNDGKGVQLRYP